MQTTIYIKKENEEFWNSLANKSVQVNHWITVAKDSAKIGNTITIPFTTHSNMKLPKTLKEANDPTKPGYSAKISPNLPKPVKRIIGTPSMSTRYTEPTVVPVDEMP